MEKRDNEIKNSLINLLKLRKDTLEFVSELSQTGDLLFFGGSIRDVYIHDEVKEFPRDFDIAIKFRNKRKFDTITKKYNFKKNRFGGYKFNVSNTEFDVWDLNNTWAFKNTYLKACEENLVKSVFLNVDGVVFNFNKTRLYTDGLNQSLNNREIDIILSENPQIELNFLRAIIFKRKYNLDLSSRIKLMIKEYCKEISESELLETFLKLQASHYKAQKITKEELKEELMSI